MSWAGRLLGGAHLELAGSDADLLPDKIDSLISHQTAHWPMMRAGYLGLENVRTKRLENPEASGSYLIVQHNPARIRSTAARVDQASIQSRKCFLCPENLPAEEMAVEYGKDFVIACNPFPVLDRHLSIIHRDHIEQRIGGHVGTLLGLARDLGPDYLALYNGPRCGASAPDHLHLQACSRALLPIESSLARLEPVYRRASEENDLYDGMMVGILEDFGRSVVVLRGRLVTDLSVALTRLLANFARITSDSSEPMINIVCTNDDGLWTIYLFPRARHRPASFFAEGDQRVTVSPGAIDMAGVIVVPREEDFSRIGVQEISGIFSEVSSGRELVRELAQSL